GWLTGVLLLDWSVGTRGGVGLGWSGCCRVRARGEGALRTVMTFSRIRGSKAQGRRSSGGGVGTGTSRPNGINRDPAQGGRRLSPNGWADNRSPAQSNQRAERGGSWHQKRNGHHHRPRMIG